MFTYESYIRELKSMGLQSTELHNAIEELCRMLSFRVPAENCSGSQAHESGATVLLSFTGRMTGTGLRKYFNFMAAHKMVDGFSTVAYAIEQDIFYALSKNEPDGNEEPLKKPEN